MNMVIGASGQVGGALFSLLADAGLEPIGTYKQNRLPGLGLQLDLESADAAPIIESHAPRRIYLTASYTNVDGCELDEARSYKSNVLAVERVVQACRKLGARLIYFSSDYVFDGLAGPYDEEAPTAPISVYGRHKVEAEQLALSLPDSVVVRTTVVYGPEVQGKNFVYRLLNTLSSGQVLRVPDDQIGNPTYNRNLAEAAIELGESGLTGIFNLAGPDIVSRFEFARAAAQVFNLPSDLIEPVSTAGLGQAARRPLSGGLTVAKAKSALKTGLIGYMDGLGLFAQAIK